MDNPDNMGLEPTSDTSVGAIYQSTYQRIHRYDKWVFIVALLFLIIATAMVIITVFYFLFWRPSIPGVLCNTDNNCQFGQVCQGNFCIEKICTSNSDCDGGGLCINSYCTAFNCKIGNDCPTGTACIGGYCVKTGGNCQSNDDCFNLSCMNQICVQCLSDSNCPTGQGCFNRSCRYPYDGETGPNMITYVSSAQNNGNISAPPGYFCSSTDCGTGMDSRDPINCGNNEICPDSCPFCVNSICRCTSGEILEPCRNNNDCASGLCDETDNGKICIPSGGECVFNYNDTDGLKICPLSKPYCVNGICSKVSLGAVCGSSDLPPDLCNNPQALGVVGPTGINPDGMGFFCINGICQENPGELNNLCTQGSCGFIESGILVCTNVDTPSISEMRCLVST